MVGLSDRGEEGVGGGAILDHVAPAWHRIERAAEADARLLNMALAAGDGQAVGAEIWVGLEEGVFDDFGGQADCGVELSQHSGAGDAVIGLAREVKVVCGAEA